MTIKSDIKEDNGEFPDRKFKSWIGKDISKDIQEKGQERKVGLATVGSARQGLSSDTINRAKKIISCPHCGNYDTNLVCCECDTHFWSGMAIESGYEVAKEDILNIIDKWFYELMLKNKYYTDPQILDNDEIIRLKEQIKELK